MSMTAREAVATGDLSSLREKLAQGASLDTKDEDERTPLHWAASVGAVDVVAFLVDEAHVRVNVQDDAGWTPLMSATSAGHVNIVSYLLSKNANANLANENGQLPLHYHRGRLEIAELLLDYTLQKNHADNVGNTPLMRAFGGHASREIVLLLIERGADVKARNKLGNTALHLALMEGLEDLARLLVDEGADPTAKNKEGVRCVDMAKPSLRAELLSIQKARRERAP